MADPTTATPEQQAALDIARGMIDAGIPIFAAPPCPAAHGGTCDRKGHNGQEEYDLPSKWQLTVPSTVWLERWRPGWGLAALGGRTADFLDGDPRNGWEASFAELKAAGQMPQAYGIATTPSGGEHFLIKPLGERKGEVPGLPGLDYQGGAPDGAGRGFVWLAPTVKRSKVDGERRPYTWVQPPDLDWLADSENDESGRAIADRLRAKRDSKQVREHDDRAERSFTYDQAQRFCTPLLEHLAAAPIGEIESRANDAAAQLSHFVPALWTADGAFQILMSYLERTAYDPDRPGTTWHADKFRAVIAGEAGRAPEDWKAIHAPESAEEAAAAVEPDAVDALLAEMLHPGQVADQMPPRYMISTLLNFDSESWLIGEPGSKKSFVALDMAGHVANGRTWQGLKVNPARVVIVVAEGAGGVSSRIKAWEKEHGPMGDEVFILPRPVQARNHGAWAVLTQACARLKPDDGRGMLIIMDTQARVTVGLKENDATDMGIYIDAVRTIREATGACVLTIHHTGRSGGDARGSSAIDGAQSTELKVVANGLSGALEVHKQKDIEMRPKMPLAFRKVDLGLDADGEALSSLVLEGENTWRDASGVRVTDPASSVLVREPQEWTEALLPDDGTVYYVVARQILQTLADVAGRGDGRTEAQIRASVVERWYAERGADSRTKRGISQQTWNRSWTRAAGLIDPASGENVIADGRGTRKIINPALGVTGE